VDTENGRVYIHPKTKEQWPSVTNILERGIPKDLAPWAASEAAKWAWANKDNFGDEAIFLREAANAYRVTAGNAARKGDIVHDLAENFLSGNPDSNASRHMKQFKDFLEVSGYSPLYTEVTIVNRAVGYAGTADFVGISPRGDVVLIDYKTGRRIWSVHAIQVEALSRGETILYPTGEEEPLPPVKEVGVLHLRPLSWWYHGIPESDPASERNWGAFLGAIQVASWGRLHPDLIFPQGRVNRETWKP
jgi:hypothetical protein